MIELPAPMMLAIFPEIEITLVLLLLKDTVPPGAVAASPKDPPGV